MNIRAAFVANPRSAKSVKLPEGSFDNPTPAAWPWHAAAEEKPLSVTTGRTRSIPDCQKGVQVLHTVLSIQTSSPGWWSSIVASAS